jgi:hypothetical protein
MKPAYGYTRDAKPDLRTKNFPFGASRSTPPNTPITTYHVQAPSANAPAGAGASLHPDNPVDTRALAIAIPPAHPLRNTHIPENHTNTLPLQRTSPIHTSASRLTRLARNGQSTLT